MAAVAATVMMVGGTLLSMKGYSDAARSAKTAGQRTRVAKEFEAEQLREQSGQAIAVSQRAALEEQRKGRLMASRALAVSAASGGGASDPTIVNLIAGAESEAAYRSAVAMYEGEDRARQLRIGAAAKDYEGAVAEEEGNQRASAYKTARAASLFKGGSSLFGKYGGGGPSGDAALVSESVPGQFSMGNPAYG